MSSKLGELSLAEQKAADALWGIICDDAPNMSISTLNRAAHIAISAYLKALAEDEALMKRAGEATIVAFKQALSDALIGAGNQPKELAALTAGRAAIAALTQEQNQ